MRLSNKILKHLLGNLLVAFFVFGGWILFIVSKISENNEVASKVKTIRIFSSVECDTLKLRIESLSEESKRLSKLLQSERDSTEYYRAFYDIMSSQYHFKYDFKKRMLTHGDVEYVGCITGVSRIKNDSLDINSK